MTGGAARSSAPPIQLPLAWQAMQLSNRAACLNLSARWQIQRRKGPSRRGPFTGRTQSPDVGIGIISLVCHHAIRSLERGRTQTYPPPASYFFCAPWGTWLSTGSSGDDVAARNATGICCGRALKREHHLGNS